MNILDWHGRGQEKTKQKFREIIYSISYLMFGFSFVIQPQRYNKFYFMDIFMLQTPDMVNLWPSTQSLLFWVLTNSFQFWNVNFSTMISQCNCYFLGEVIYLFIQQVLVECLLCAMPDTLGTGDESALLEVMFQQQKIDNKLNSHANYIIW